MAMARDRGDQKGLIMAIYVDPQFRGARIRGNTLWSHMGTDDRSAAGLEALHAFAARLGLRHKWFQDKPRHKHYDLFPSKRALAVKLGAIELSQRDYVRTCGDYPAAASRLIEETWESEPVRVTASVPVRQKDLFD